MICLTFDIEERFHSHLTPDNTKPHWLLYDRVSKLIEWIHNHNKKATFFVVGEFAEQYPELIRQMVDIHCEVASHTFTHIKISKSNASACLEEIKRSKIVLEDITGQPVYGFRAPSWRARLEDRWLWDNLSELGFMYDASLFPFTTNCYGSSNYPLSPFPLLPEFLEIPPAVFKAGFLRVPYAGGFYFRFFPRWLTTVLSSIDIKSGKTPVFYFHPWEFELSPVMLEKGLFNKFIGNYNVSRNWQKFTSLFENISTCTCLEYYKSIKNSKDL